MPHSGENMFVGPSIAKTHPPIMKPYGRSLAMCWHSDTAQSKTERMAALKRRFQQMAADASTNASTNASTDASIDANTKSSTATASSNSNSSTTTAGSEKANKSLIQRLLDEQDHANAARKIQKTIIRSLLDEQDRVYAARGTVSEADLP